MYSHIVPFPLCLQTHYVRNIAVAFILCIIGKAAPSLDQFSEECPTTQTSNTNFQRVSPFSITPVKVHVRL